MTSGEDGCEPPKSRMPGTHKFDQRHVNELLNVLFPPAKARQRWNDLLSRLEADAPKDVLMRYVKQGGNLLALVGCLRNLQSSKQLADNRDFSQFQRRAFSCLKAIEALLKIQKQVPESVVRIAMMLRAELVQACQIRLTYEKGKAISKGHVKNSRSKQGGRPEGSQASMLPCLLGIEFRRVFRNPRYEDILVLVKAANPDEFLSSTTSEHIRQRIRHFQQANKRRVEDLHSKLFPVVHP